ncbi:MAG: Protein kinase [Bryobacterales bacterium]|nr:Protein kinase [Bryobacterales bacterium]
MRRFLVSAVLAVCLAAGAEAASHRLNLYPNSFTIFSMAEGPDHLLWLATSDGLYRFDGFHYHKITDYPFSFARFVAFTGDGSLWVGSYEGLARARPGKSFEVILTEEVISLAAYPDQVFVRLTDLVQIRLDGSVRHLGHHTRRDLLIDSSGMLWSTCISPNAACWIDPTRPEQLQQVQGLEVSQAAVRDSQGRLWVSNDEHAMIFQDGRALLTLQRKPTVETRRTNPLLPGGGGQLWFLGEAVRGLVQEVEFRDRADHDRYPPISGLEDSRGHVWVASLGQGLVEWVPDQQWQRWFPEDFDNEPVVLLVRDHQGSLVLATHKHLYRWNQQTGKWRRFAEGDHRYEGLLPLDDGGFLATMRDLGVVRLSSDGRIVERIKDLLPEGDKYRKIIRDGKGRIWIGAKRILLRIEGKPGSLRLREEHLPGDPFNGYENSVDLEVDRSGRLWAGYQNGIAWLDDEDHWHQVPTNQPITEVRSFTLAGDDFWIAHRQSGAFTRLSKDRDRWNVSTLAANAGYGPTDSLFIKRDSRGWIWRGATDGVHISDGHNFGPNDWLHIHLGNGLAANEMDIYGFFEDADGTVWIAGAEGLTHFRPDPSWFQAPREAPVPQVTRLITNGHPFLYPAAIPHQLPASTTAMEIDVGSLGTPPFRDVPFRYRLLPLSKEWRVSTNGTLQFANLSPLAYTLEIGYAGDGPPKVSTFSLRIGAPSREVSWLWTLLFLTGTGAVIAIIRYAPGLDGFRFRMGKAIFVLRRRYSDRTAVRSTDALRASGNYSGRTLSGRYLLSRIVSRGGFSVVYEGSDLSNGNARIAVKVLNRGSGSSSYQDGWLRDRFAHEVASLRSVDHPGVVRILDSWVSSSGEPCLAMPFLEGQTLRTALSEKPFTLERVARIVNQLGAALAEVHDRGIVHRDLKPENLILLRPATDLEQVVIIDFGTAGLRTGDDELAATTLLAGSFHYMAPERLTGHYSAASDRFSFAVIVLEMLTGKRLPDLRVMFSDASFLGELQKALGVTLSQDAAQRVANLLGPAFDPEPRRRPANTRAWAEELAAAIYQKI